MEVYVARTSQGKNSTLSTLHINGEQICYVLEDTVRDEKITGSTAIPAGRYKLAFRRHGGMNGRYKKIFPDFHQGMLQLMHVPNFSYIYIHMGNNFSDTSGCLLVGKNKKYFKDWDEYEIRQSKKAYVELYKRLAAAMQTEEVYVVLRDELSVMNE